MSNWSQNIAPESLTKPAKGAWALFWILALGYVFSQFIRNTIGVITPDLMGEMDLGPADVGLLSGLFFLAFAAMQIPAGMALDTLGPRKTMAGLVLIGAGGMFLFAGADEYSGLVIGRVLTGIGTAALLMGPMVLFTRWFPASRFAEMSGLVIACGGAGTLLATAPFEMAVSSFGWRESLFGVAIAMIAMSLILALRVKDVPSGRALPTAEHADEAGLWQGMKAVFKHKQLPYLVAIQLMGYSSVVTLLGLWGLPYLQDVHGLPKDEAANILFVMALVVMVGQVGWGRLDRIVGSRRRPVLWGAILCFAQFLTLALYDDPPLPVVIGLFWGLGLSSGFFSIALAHGRALFPDHLVGRGITTLNVANMGGVFILQSLTGWIIDLNGGSEAGPIDESAFRFVFLTIAFGVLAALTIYSWSEDRPPQ